MGSLTRSKTLNLKAINVIMYLNSLEISSEIINLIK